ncbi:MAG TPA: SPFH domain-containing protein [Bryobacteraceae bacterium]|jgi:regulator of protease activity HflC (stomatin/prohibitin superfamily)|nr:SPFH domain-containing protein [Bryobacteraceae bacterium]
MFGICYRKANPTEYVLHFRNGRAVREGAGLSFFYFAPSSTLVSVPMASVNIPFVFTEPAADFQTVTVQGQLTYRIADPQRAAAMLDLTVDSRGRYQTDQYQKLPERLVYSLQTLIRARIQLLPLREALMRGDAISGIVFEQLKANPDVVQLGVEILSLAVLALRPSPEMAKALEAEARESLNRTADQAVYTRRNAAVEQERLIKQNELETQLLVQTREAELRAKDLDAQIGFEQQRAALTDQKSENERKEADARAYSLKAVIGPVQGLDWRVLMMLNPNAGDARTTIAMAFQELAANAQKIGELNVSPDLLRTLIGSSAVAHVRS